LRRGKYKRKKVEVEGLPALDKRVSVWIREGDWKALSLIERVSIRKRNKELKNLILDERINRKRRLKQGLSSDQRVNRMIRGKGSAEMTKKKYSKEKREKEKKTEDR